MTATTLFEQAKAQADALNAAVKAASQVLNAYPKGHMGLTPDAVKFSQEYKAAHAAYCRAFEASRTFNAWYTKAFKAELRAARQARFAA